MTKSYHRTVKFFTGVFKGVVRRFDFSTVVWKLLICEVIVVRPCDRLNLRKDSIYL